MSTVIKFENIFEKHTLLHEDSRATHDLYNAYRPYQTFPKSLYLAPSLVKLPLTMAPGVQGIELVIDEQYKYF